MKKHLLVIILVIFLVGCSKTSHEIIDATAFDEIVNRAVVKYDLRSYEECEAGHIPGFICVGVNDSDPIEQAIYNITNKYSDYKKSDIIVLIASNQGDAKLAASSIAKKGFKKVYYFSGGYSEYVRQKGDEFVPEVGCDC